MHHPELALEHEFLSHCLVVHKQYAAEKPGVVSYDFFFDSKCSREDFLPHKCRTVHAIKAWTKMLAIKIKITSVDKVVFRLISYRLLFLYIIVPVCPLVGEFRRQSFPRINQLLSRERASRPRQEE